MRTAVYGRGAGSTNGARAGLTVTGSIVLQDHSSADEPARAARVIWLLLGPKAGDNAQVQALAEALVARGGFRAEPRTLRFHGAELLTQALRLPHTLPKAASAGSLVNQSVLRITTNISPRMRATSAKPIA